MNKIFFLSFVLILSSSLISSSFAQTNNEDSNLESLHDAHNILINSIKNNISSFQTSGFTSDVNLPLSAIYVDETLGELVVGLNPTASQSEQYYKEQLQTIIGNDIPIKLVIVVMKNEDCPSSTQDDCTPLIGGIGVSRRTTTYDSTLTLPVIKNDDTKGMIASGHVYENFLNYRIYQLGNRIGVVTDIDSLDGRSSDAAFIQANPNIDLKQQIFNPNDVDNPFNVIGAMSSTEHSSGFVAKSGASTGYSSGNIINTGVTMLQDHDRPLDGTVETTLFNQVIADYNSNSGDSGSPIFSDDVGNDVYFYGIHVGAACFLEFPLQENDVTIFPRENDCNVAGGNYYRVYSPWEAIQEELDLKDIDGTFLDIPEWIKNNAGWWADGQIDDNSFVQGIQFLIKENIMEIPPTTQGISSGSNEIPDWIKNNAGWWADGQITDDDFVQGIQFLITEGIMNIEISSFAEIQNLSESYRQLQITPLSDESLTPVSGSNTQGCEPNCYSSTILSVDTGSTITFSNDIGSPNTFTSGSPHDGPDGTWDSGLLQSGQSYSVTLDTPGTYQYYSQVHPWMQGSIIVGATSTNLPPTADAGDDKTADEQTLVVLSGSGNDPENQGQIRYTWKQITGEPVSLSGSNLAGGVSNSQFVSFTAPDVSSSTVMTFQLTVKDDTLQAGTDTVTVTINPVTTNVNHPPTANAGADDTYNENTLVTLDGSGSSDPDSGDTITYLWQQLQGPAVSFVNNIQSPTFTAPDVTAGSVNLQFKLLVKDSANVPSIPDYVTITISDVPLTPDNNAPISRNDVAQTTGVTPVIIDVLFNDSDSDGDTITVHSVDGSITSGTVTNNGDTITFTADELFSGSTTFTYTIIDSQGAISESSQVTVDVFVQQDSGDATWVANHPNFVANDHFGQSADFLSNGNVLVGAPDHDTNGSVTVLSENDGAELFTITNPQNTPDDFGYSISSLNDNVVVGAPLYDVGNNADAGAVYVYDSSGTLKFPVIQNPEPSSFDKFGISVAASNNRIFVGVPAHDVVVLNTAEQNSITQTFDSFVIFSDSTTQSATTDLNLVADTTANTIEIIDGTTGDVISDIAHYTSYDPETLSSSNTLDVFALSDGITTTDDDADFADVGIPPVLILDNTANTMNLVDTTTDNILVSSTIPDSTTQNSLILFYNELTNTSYVYDSTTGVLVLTEFGNAGAVYVFDSTTGAHITPPINNPNPASNDNLAYQLMQ